MQYMAIWFSMIAFMSHLRIIIFLQFLGVYIKIKITSVFDFPTRYDLLHDPIEPPPCTSHRGFQQTPLLASGARHVVSLERQQGWGCRGAG